MLKVGNHLQQVLRWTVFIADLIYSSEEGKSAEIDQHHTINLILQFECPSAMLELTRVPSVGVSITSVPVLQFGVPAFSVHSASHLPAPLWAI